EAASSWFRPRVVGINRAVEWAATGRVFSAEEALEGGLVRSLYEPEDLLPAAHALAREIVENTAPVSVALARRLMWDMLGASHPMEAHRADSRAMLARGQSGDVREGVASFLEKRSPSVPEPGRSVIVDTASATTHSSTACCRPAFVPKWCCTRPGETPAARATSRMLVPATPRLANSSSAALRMRA